MRKVERRNEKGRKKKGRKERANHKGSIRILMSQKEVIPCNLPELGC